VIARLLRAARASTAGKLEKGYGMAIYRLFKNQAFEPEAISAMTRTYADVCRAFGLSDSDAAETGGARIVDRSVDRTRVAKTVIEYAQRGVRDHTRLRDCVLQALKQ
jgi:hypothetical protein